MKVQNIQNSPAFSSRTVRTQKILEALKKNPIKLVPDLEANPVDNLSGGGQFWRLGEKDQKFVRSAMAYETFVLKRDLQEKLSGINKFLKGAN